MKRATMSRVGIAALVAAWFCACAQSQGQTDFSKPKTPASPDGRTAFEQLALEVSDVGIDGQRTVDGLVINVKNPIRIIANDKVMTVTSTTFRENNLRYASIGMRSWMGLTYTISEENNKSVTVFVKEFEKPEAARNAFPGLIGTKTEVDPKQHSELKGSLFHRILHGTFVVDVQWSDSRSAGVERIIAAYKTKLLTL